MALGNSGPNRYINLRVYWRSCISSFMVYSFDHWSFFSGIRVINLHTQVLGLLFPIVNMAYSCAVFLSTNHYRPVAHLRFASCVITKSSCGRSCISLSANLSVGLLVLLSILTAEKLSLFILSLWVVSLTVVPHTTAPWAALI